ncbi:hypothetical protein PCIT_b0589 [Pseudoalteromonas citrea]|uniref:Uncharacterized protein n=1 Tax=Pseudoalteromonas citrea TaxID=43655 RepID=A0AAD4FQ16_9GAMM|nr:hypothetical protein PCIT_b0589 [Pseudoalteromonas citrea]
MTLSPLTRLYYYHDKAQCSKRKANKRKVTKRKIAALKPLFFINAS